MKTHGHSQTTTWVIWQNAKQRCFNKKSTAYRYYGARGITMCERWRTSFAAFIADMGLRPSPLHSIGRINNHGNYEPLNCRWENAVEQANNTRQNRTIEWKGKSQTISEWSREVGLPRRLISARLNAYRWSVDRALSTPNFYHARPTNRPLLGEDHGMAKLNDDKVRQIRERHDQGMTGRAIAKEFAVSTATVSLIVNRRIWSHL